MDIIQTKAKRPRPDGDENLSPMAPSTRGAFEPMVLFKQLRRVKSILLGKGESGAFVSLLKTAVLL